MREFNSVLKQVVVSICYIYLLFVAVLTIDQAAASACDWEPFFAVQIGRDK